MTISKQTIETYLNDVISTKPVPGGGSVSALIGSQGAALAGMLIALTAGKKAFQAFAPDEQQLFHELGNFYALQKERLLQLSSDDINAYNAFLEAVRLPKDTEEEKSVRHAAMQDAQMHAMQVPLEMARTALESLEQMKPVAEKGSANAISDGAVGAMCLNLAVQGGLYNVRINLPGLDDDTLVRDTADACDRIKAKAESLLADILAIVERRLG